MWKSTVLFDVSKYFSLVLRTTIAFQSSLCPLSAKKVIMSHDINLTLHDTDIGCGLV